MNIVTKRLGERHLSQCVVNTKYQMGKSSTDYKTPFWIHDFKTLFQCDGGISNLHFIPMVNMTIEERLNATTRLVFVIFVLFLVTSSPIWSIIFLLICIAIINIIYYIVNRMTVVEHYTNTQTHLSIKRPKTAKIEYHIDTNRLPQSSTLNHTIRSKAPPPNTFKLPNYQRKLEFNENFKSSNQALVGPPNPRTKVAPIVVAPCLDLSFWKNNDLATFPCINKETNVDLYQSGFISTTCHGNTQNEYLIPENPRDKYTKSPDLEPLTNIHNPDEYEYEHEEEDDTIKEGFCGGCSTSGYKNPTEVKYGEEIDKNTYDTVYQQREIPGLVNMQCGYNPSQLDVNLPTNLAVGNCEQMPEMSNFNNNVFTQTIQPGVYTKSDIIEPVNSNIGISFTQQFPPVTCEMTENGGTLYTSHDPNLVDVKVPDDNFEVSEAVTNANIYDPRHSGYGTSYRSYTEEVTGQTRFAYDDVNAIRMPNYITRSNIDFEPYADSYGPMKNPKGNEFHSKIRSLAQDSWLRNSLKFRNDIQERSMRKHNANAWQQRVAPIRTSTSAGQMNLCR